MIIISLLLKGYKVTEIADELYDKYKNDKKYLKYKKAVFICSILYTCSKLEQLGVIRQLEVIWHEIFFHGRRLYYTYSNDYFTSMVEKNSQWWY